MYQSFYGLTDKPFQLNPDPSFYFGSREHRRAMAYLEYGLHQNEGFIVVTGEVGTGKTTLIRSLLSKLDPHQVVAAQLVSTQLDAEDTLRMVCAAFGLPAKDIEKSDALVSLEGFLRSVAKDGRRALLIIDEAQNLAPRAVEELRMLSNFQVGTNALVQSFLVGQPEFRQTMCSPHMQQLRQRVIASCHISPLSSDDTRAYIEHRLGHAGWKNDPTISEDAFESIFRFSGGTPRRINTLCDRLLLSGFLNESHEFSATDVETVANELSEETFSTNRSLASGNLTEAQIAGPTNLPGTAPRQWIAATKSDIADSATESGLRLLGGLQVDSMLERLARLERSSEIMIVLLQQLLHQAPWNNLTAPARSTDELSNSKPDEDSLPDPSRADSVSTIRTDLNPYQRSEERKEGAA